MPKLSLCMIVKDEEPMLRRCLESVQGCVDEMIVVDTGSTDRTIEIAKRPAAHQRDGSVGQPEKAPERLY